MTTQAQRIVEQYRLGAIDRRQFAQILAAAGLTLTVVPLVTRQASAATDLTVFEWSGYDLPEFHQEYIDKYGASPDFTFFGELEEALQKLRTGFSADVTHPCTSSIGRWYDAGAIAPVDVSRLTYWGDIFPSMRDIKAPNRDGNVLGVPFDWGNSSILYRTDLVEPMEPSYNLYLDERYAGRMAFFDSADGFAQVTGLIQGVNPFTMDEEQLGEAADIMRRIQQNLRFYWTDPTEIEQALASGEVVLAYSWNGSAANLKAQGVPVTFMDPKEGILTWVCCVALGANGTGSEEQAYDFINAMTSPEAGKNLIEMYGYGHSNTKAFELVDQAKLDELGISDPVAMMAKGTFIEEMAPATRERVIEIFDDVKSGM
jgi:spermidine/putrescine-binding protein